jgi:seryl-tRNA synthetase
VAAQPRRGGPRLCTGISEQDTLDDRRTTSRRSGPTRERGEGGSGQGCVAEGHLAVGRYEHNQVDARRQAATCSPSTRRSTLIDVRAARSDPDRFRAALARKGGAANFDAFLGADAEWRGLDATVGALRARSRPKGKPTPEELVVLAGVKDELRTAESTLEELASRRDALLAAIPNPPDDSAPDGDSEEDAVEVSKFGEPPEFTFAPRNHMDLGGFDTERATRLSGTRFAYRMGATALVELSLYRYALDHLVRLGFTPVLPPVIVREEALYGTGFLPTDETNLYRVEPDGLYLSGTSEVALAGLHQGEILDGGEMPLRYAGYSTNFRREAGAAGRDTKGIMRLHQFDKVEMFFYTFPERSAENHEEILATEEAIVQGLGLAYRVINTAAGDLGPSAAKKYDIEAWIPSEDRYREITSCSNTTDYQARRLGIRYRDGETLRTPHTLNGTAMTARFLIAILESFQDEAGRVAVPEVLHAFGAPATIEPAGRAR